jgi:photosynthetic reaction center H subunit
MSSALTSYIDVAQVVLYGFWAFFFGLIYWLRKEDRREGYPLVSSVDRTLRVETDVLIPPAKTFLLPHGGTATAPSFQVQQHDIRAKHTTVAGATILEPDGDPMTAGIGAGSYAKRADEPELTREGHDLIVPIRVAGDFKVNAGPDPRGWDVVATDGETAGKVKEIWVDRADVMVRYLEVELSAADAGTRLLPITMLRLQSETKRVEVASIRAAHFASVPTLRNADRVTVLEEERICAFYAGGRRYAEPKRLGPVV